jgi:hypothetical protein
MASFSRIGSGALPPKGQVIRNRSQKSLVGRDEMNTLRLVGCVLLLTILLSLSSVAAFAQAATFTATPSPVPPGQTVTFNGNPVIPVTVSNVKVTLWFHNSIRGFHCKRIPCRQPLAQARLMK